MKTAGWRPVLAIAIGLAGLALLPASAHQVPPQVESYFKVEGASLEVLSRLPLLTLLDAKLPVATRGMLDVETARPKLDAAAAEFVRNAEIMDGATMLAAPAIDWAVSPSRDLSFSSFDRAAARFRNRQPVEEAVDASAGFLDVRLVYRLSSSAPRLSVRLNSQRIAGAFIPTRVVYVTPSGGTREFTEDGAPVRRAFEPAWRDVASMFAGFGAARFLAEQELVLFLFALALLLPISSAGVLSAAVVLLLYGATGLVAALWPGSPSVSMTLLIPIVASTALVIAAVQNIVPPRLGWVLAVSVLFGMASGGAAGLAARPLLALAGSNAFGGLLVLLGVVVVAGASAAALLRFVSEWTTRLPLPARAVAVVLAFIPLHQGLHRLQEESQAIGDVAAIGLNRDAWLLTAHYWPFFLALAGLTWLIAVARLPGVKPASRVTS